LEPGSKLTFYFAVTVQHAIHALCDRLKSTI